MYAILNEHQAGIEIVNLLPVASVPHCLCHSSRIILLVYFLKCEAFRKLFSTKPISWRIRLMKKLYAILHPEFFTSYQQFFIIERRSQMYKNIYNKSLSTWEQICREDYLKKIKHPRVYPKCSNTHVKIWKMNDAKLGFHDNINKLY